MDFACVLACIFDFLVCSEVLSERCRLRRLVFIPWNTSLFFLQALKGQVAGRLDRIPLTLIVDASQMQTQLALPSDVLLEFSICTFNWCKTSASIRRVVELDESPGTKAPPTLPHDIDH